MGTITKSFSRKNLLQNNPTHIFNLFTQFETIWQ